MGVFDVAQLFIDYVKENCPDEVAIIAYYGSYALGTQSATSDLDMFYIPSKDNTIDLYKSILVDGLPYEFWGGTWEYFEKRAKNNYSIAPSLIVNAKILYARSEADLQRFNQLKEKLLELKEPKNKMLLLNNAINNYKDVLLELENMKLSNGDLTSVRYHGYELISHCINILGLINQTSLNRSWMSDLNMVQQFEKRPPNLKDYIEQILCSDTSGEIIQGADDLAQEIRTMIMQEKNNDISKSNIADVFSGFYPAIKEYLNKILKACLKKDRIGAIAASLNIQKDITFMLESVYRGVHSSALHLYKDLRYSYDELKFPDLVQFIQKNHLEEVSHLVEQFDHRIRMFLTEHHVSLCEYSFEELKNQPLF